MTLLGGSLALHLASELCHSRWAGCGWPASSAGLLMEATCDECDQMWLMWPAEGCSKNKNCTNLCSNQKLYITKIIFPKKCTSSRKSALLRQYNFFDVQFVIWAQICTLFPKKCTSSRKMFVFGTAFSTRTLFYVLYLIPPLQSASRWATDGIIAPFHHLPCYHIYNGTCEVTENATFHIGHLRSVNWAYRLVLVWCKVAVLMVVWDCLWMIGLYPISLKWTLDIWTNYFGYMAFCFMDFSFLWTILGGTNVVHISGIGCMTISLFFANS